MSDIATLAKRAVEAVDNGELVKLLQRMIRMRSYSAGGEEAEIARFMQDHCAALGLESSLQVGLVCGPGGRYNTMPDERVDLVDLFNAARVYARTIVETCH